MLRLLHTADWHLGHVLHGLDRAAEHAAFLSWLLDALERERADALLVAGDVFDAANPPASAVAAWYGFLAAAWSRLPRLQILVVGGNHDSASRLDAPHPLLDALGRLHVVGALPRRDGALDGDRLVVPLRDAEGRVAAVAAAIPFLRPADLTAARAAAPRTRPSPARGTQIALFDDAPPAPPAPAPEAEDDVGAAVRALHDEALALARGRAAALGPDLALVALGHLYLAGGQVSALSERKILGGNLQAVGESLFPEDVAYAALGHLHLAQRVGAREHVRYAGAPVPLSFDERHYPQQVVLVDLEGSRATAIRPLPVPRWRELLRIPEGPPAPLPEVLELLRALPPRGSEADEALPLLEVRVALAEPEPRLRARVEEAVDGRAVRLARLARTDTGDGRPLAAAGPSGAARDLADLDPEEVFVKKWASAHAAPPPDDVLAAFRALVAELHAGEEAPRAVA